jgi:hypothetical protein
VKVHAICTTVPHYSALSRRINKCEVLSNEITLQKFISGAALQSLVCRGLRPRQTIATACRHEMRTQYRGEVCAEDVWQYMHHMRHLLSTLDDKRNDTCRCWCTFGWCRRLASDWCCEPGDTPTTGPRVVTTYCSSFARRLVDKTSILSRVPMQRLRHRRQFRRHLMQCQNPT